MSFNYVADLVLVVSARSVSVGRMTLHLPPYTYSVIKMALREDSPIEESSCLFVTIYITSIRD